MSAYANRLADAVAWRLPDDVTVTADTSGLIFERGNARALAYLPRGDARRRVTDSDVFATLEAAATRLRRDIPHYRPAFVTPARELVAILQDATARVHGRTDNDDATHRAATARELELDASPLEV